MQPNGPRNVMIAAAEHLILGVLCVGVLSLGLLLIRSGLSLT